MQEFKGALETMKRRMQQGAMPPFLQGDSATHGAYYKNAPTGSPAGSAFSGTSYGYFGGTNIKGHLVKFNYSFTDSLTFTMTCFVNDLINPGLNAPLGEPQNHAVHAMADLAWKF